MHVRMGVDLRRSATLTEGVGTDAQLRHAIERDVRAGQDRAVVVLHVSRVQPLRPHHRLVAKAMLDDAAQTYAGQVFVRRNADIVLICNPPGVDRLETMLTRVFDTGALSGTPILTRWTLPMDTAALEQYLGQTMTSVASIAGPGGELAATGAMTRMAGMPHVTDLIRRQMAVEIRDGMRPLYRELKFSVTTLAERVEATDFAHSESAPADQAQADPYLFRHMAARLDARMMDLLTRELARPGALPPGPALHLNLMVASILSPGFLRLAEAAQAAGAQIGAVIAPIDAYADPLAFNAARMALHALNVALVVGPADHHALSLTRMEMLEPALFKLDWAPGIAGLPASGQARLATALRRIGLDRIVLYRTHAADALDWGQAHGITRFQGRHIDALLAAERLGGCRQSGACTVHQCTERAAATGLAGRVGCRDAARLDMTPSQMPSPA